MKIHHKMSHGDSLATEEATCNNCSSTFTYYPSEKDGKYCPKCVSDGVGWVSNKSFGKDNPNWNNKYETFKAGSENCNWKGGVETDYGSTWPKWRRTIRDRDSGECQSCGAESNIQIHHIVPRRSFDDVDDAHYNDNLVSLCRTCHKLVEHGSLECPEPKDLSSSSV
jgi:5-methylcytosine-specific restriction endonuclease McrA